MSRKGKPPETKVNQACQGQIQGGSLGLLGWEMVKYAGLDNGNDCETP